MNELFTGLLQNGKGGKQIGDEEKAELKRAAHAVKKPR